MFLANYSDGLTDFPLPKLIEEFLAARRLCNVSLGAAALQQPRHRSLERRRFGAGIKCMKDSDIWVNGGYFVLRKEVFRYIKPGEELVYEPLAADFRRESLVAALRRLLAVHGHFPRQADPRRTGGLGRRSLVFWKNGQPAAAE